jgi:hypothetical protein
MSELWTVIFMHAHNFCLGEGPNNVLLRAHDSQEAPSNTRSPRTGIMWQGPGNVEQTHREMRATPQLASIYTSIAAWRANRSGSKTRPSGLRKIQEDARSTVGASDGGRECTARSHSRQPVVSLFHSPQPFGQIVSPSLRSEPRYHVARRLDQDS